MSITLSALQQQRRDTASNWTSANPTLLGGEWGYETDTGKWKVGDGSTAWTSLAYVAIPDNNGLIPIDQLLLPLGSASAPSLAFTGDVNTGLYSPGADQVAISTNGTGRLFVDASGNVGINATTFPANGTNLKTADGTIARHILEKTGTNARIFEIGNGGTFLNIYDATADSERLRIDSSGNVGIGTSSPSEILTLRSTGEPKIQIEDADLTNRIGQISQAGGAMVFRSRADTSNGQFVFRGYGGGSDTDFVTIDTVGRLLVGTASTSQNVSGVFQGGISAGQAGVLVVARDSNTANQDDTIGLLRMTGNGHTGGSQIRANADGSAWTAGSSQPTRLGFETTPSGSTSPVERMRIDSSGRVGIGTTSPSQLLEVAGSVGNIQLASSGAEITFTRSGPSAITASDASGSLLFQTGGINERARIDSSGRLGIGTTTFATNSKFAIQTSAGKLDICADGGSSVKIINGGGITFDSASGHYFNKGTDEFMRLSSTGNLGIGTTSPGKALSVKGSSYGQAEIVGPTGSELYFVSSEGGSSNGTISYNHASNYMNFYTAGAERVRIDSSGRLLVGTSNSSDNIRLDQKLAIANASSSSSSHTGINITNYSNQATVCPVIDLKKSRSNTDGGTTVVQNGDNLGYLVFQGADGSQFHRAAEIAAFVDGTPGANDMPGRLVFSVTADGASSPTEAMRIKNSRILNLANTPVYADNAAAKTGGLVDGDVYRKSDGTLMIVYT